MYKRLRYIVRYSRAFLAKHYLPLFLGVTLAVLAIIFIPRIITLVPQFRVTRHIAIIGRYSLTNLPMPVQSKLSIGLTVIGQNGVPGPGLASGWDIQDEGKTIVFNINPDLAWHDNTPIYSRDIQYSFRGAQIEYPNDRQIVFKLLQDPYSPLTSLVSQPVFKQSSGRFGRRIIGSGSYKIKSYKQNGVSLDTLTLAPSYPDNNLPFLTYHFYSSPQQARTAFKLGTIHEIIGLLQPDDLSSWPDTEVIPVIQEDKYVAVFFNTGDPFLTGASGKNLRLALAYATTKTAEKNRATGPISPSSWAFYSGVKKYDYDLVRAKELLKKVEKIPDTLTIRTLPAYIDQAEQIKSDWEKLGLTVDISSQSELPMEFQIALVAQAIPIDPDQYIYWHSTESTTNITHLNNPRIDKLLEDGRKSWDFEVRKNIYLDFQRFLVEEIPAIFLYHPIFYTVIRN